MRSNEELKLSARAGDRRGPGDALEGSVGCAGMGRSLTPVRYPAPIVLVKEALA